ncbi:MAG: spirocyclase AveC family protein [Mycobacterium sp.]|nr:spirocyclase AveC family protein [Mycobacterium sp.]
MRNSLGFVDETGNRPLTRLGLAWPALGVLSGVLIVWKISSWVAAGVTSVSPGHDTMPTLNLLVMHALEWVQFGAFVIIVGLVVVRPLIRRKALEFDGLFVLGAILLNFWDVLDNYWVFAFQYNAYQLNVSSWAGLIPGWHSPAPHLWAVPLAFVFGAYTWAFFLAVRMGTGLIQRIQKIFPACGILPAFGAVFVVDALLAAVSENVYLRVGAIANIRPYESLTLWDGTTHAFPLYNPILFGFTWTAMTALRWSRDARGFSFVERSIADVVRAPRAQTVLRFFAVFAFMEVAYILLYFLPFNVLASLRTAPPNVFPSYFPVP